MMADGAPNENPPEAGELDQGSARLPRWVPIAVVIFWAGYIGSLIFRWAFSRLAGLLLLLVVSLFLSFAIEPGVNRLSERGWRRGRATGLIQLGTVVVIGLFIGAIGTLVGSQVADLLQNTDQYVNRIVKFLNDNFGTKINPNDVNESIKDPNGGFQRFIDSQRDDACSGCRRPPWVGCSRCSRRCCSRSTWWPTGPSCAD